MTWVFVLIAFTTSGATVERVLLDSPAHCIAYGQGCLSRPEMHAAQVQMSQCIGLRSGVAIDVHPTHQEQRTP